MEWLMHNPLADMYGPQFLLLYAAVIFVTVLACRAAMRRHDWTRSEGLPVIPPSPDPYEIAYLRGGENELMRSVVFGLIQRDHLRSDLGGKRPMIERTPATPDKRALKPIELRAYDWFYVARDVRELFAGDGLSGQLKSFGAAYEQRLTGERLLTPPEVRAAAFRIWCAGASVVAALGGYKLLVALGKGRYNVGFLVVMGLAALIVLGFVCRPSRLSARGKAYLERLQLAFDRLKTQAAQRRTHELSITPTAAGATAQAGATDPALLLAVGLFGVGALAGTAYDDYHRTFQQSASSPGGSCGGSSGGDGGGGSSCSSGSSCSGGSSCGGGGCGGGGCGGCGS